MVMRVHEGGRLLAGPAYKAMLLLTPFLLCFLLFPSGPFSPRQACLFFLNMLLYLLFAYGVNDYADRDQDALSGKFRRIASWPRQAGIGICVALAAGNIVVGILIAGWGGYVILLVMGLVFGLAYSVRPMRLKERGIWGILVAPVLGKVIPISMVASLCPKTGWWLVILLIGEWTKNAIDILFHQIVDFRSDAGANAATFAVIYGRARSVGLLRRFCLGGTLAAVAVGISFAVYVPEYRWVMGGSAAAAVPIVLLRRLGFIGLESNEITALVPFHYMGVGYAVFLLAPFWLGLIAMLRDAAFGLVFFPVAALTVFQTRFYLR
ncbi:MAG: UbiA family prenyltransferase, partial [Deltaproteobacteria bacterium]|nr:UbiA family prenyltransferase [Deltaproteobacteria bacterium]